MADNTQLVLVAFIAAIPPTVVACGGVLAIYFAHRKLDHITYLTNSTLSAANKMISELKAEIARLITERDKRDQEDRHG